MATRQEMGQALYDAYYEATRESLEPLEVWTVAAEKFIAWLEQQRKKEDG